MGSKLGRDRLQVLDSHVKVRLIPGVEGSPCGGNRPVYVFGRPFRDGSGNLLGGRVYDFNGSGACGFNPGSLDVKLVPLD